MNYEGYARSNYFHVLDDQKFEAAFENIPGIELEKAGDAWCILADEFMPDYDEDDQEIDIPLIVSKHLIEDEVAVFVEVGFEGLRYLNGQAEAINAKGERKLICLYDIYKEATSLGKHCSKAEY